MRATTPIVRAGFRQVVTVEGRIASAGVGDLAGPALEILLDDGTGTLRLLFMGRSRIAGLEPGVIVRARGRVGDFHGCLAVANPYYELVAMP